jgi:hypothetical protein
MLMLLRRVYGEAAAKLGNYRSIAGYELPFGQLNEKICSCSADNITLS